MRLLSLVVSWSLRNRPVVLLGTLLFIALGVRAALTLPLDAFPDVTGVQVMVITAAPALSPVEVEKYVTVPVERALAGLPRSTEVRSLSKYGMSVITVLFRDDTDIYFARQLVGERMREATDAVPAQYGRPEMGPISSGLGEIYQFTVENPALSLMQLEELLDWQIAPQLRTVPGIVEVNSFGGEDRQYQVVLDPRRLEASGFSVADAVRALERTNANAGGGYIEHARQQLVVGTEGLVRDLGDLRQVVIGATPQGVPVTIANVGDVRFGPRLRRGAATSDGKGEAVVGVALMLLGENSRTVTDAVKERLVSVQQSLPPGTRIEPFYDRAALVDRTVQTVGKNLLEGALLVVVVLFLLLGELRAGLVVATVIPLSLLFAVLMMHAFNLTGNLMSLGAIDFGLLVDGAVIIVENVVRRLSERGASLAPHERIQVVEAATFEVRSASVFGEAIIAIVYLPVLTLVGLEGKLFRPMAITVLLALGGAFILSLTLVPVLSSLFVRPGRHTGEPWILRALGGAYRPMLGAALRHRGLVILGAAAALFGAIFLFTRLGAEFVPTLEEGDLVVEARRLPGVALSESIQIGLRAERALLATPEIKRVVSRLGSPELALDPMGVEQSDLFVSLHDRKTWRPGLDKPALVRELSKRLEEAVPDMVGGFSQPIQMRTNELIAGIRSDVAALVYGDDLETLRRLGDEVAAELRRVPGAADVRVEQVAGLRYLRIKPDRAKLARYGLTIEDVNQITETIAVGHHVGAVLEGDRRFSIVVRTDHGFDGDLEPLRALPLRSVSGQVVPLGDVAEMGFESGPAVVNRSGQSRRILVEMNVRDRDLSSVVADAKAAVESRVKRPTGYRIEWGGQFQHYAEARTRLAVVVPIALALIGFLLWLAFRSIGTAAVVFLSVPLSIVGGVASLALRGIPFSISAGVGFIALFGVAVLNGLVLVSFARHLEDGGMSRGQSIVRAAELRLRPVLTTALVASLGFLPMALSTEPGSEIQRPLATVVIGGLVSATLLTLFVLPAVYEPIRRRRRIAASAQEPR